MKRGVIRFALGTLGVRKELRKVRATTEDLHELSLSLSVSPCLGQFNAKPVMCLPERGHLTNQVSETVNRLVRAASYSQLNPAVEIIDCALGLKSGRLVIKGNRLRGPLPELFQEAQVDIRTGEGWVLLDRALETSGGPFGFLLSDVD